MGWRHDPPHLSPAPLGLAVHGPMSAHDSVQQAPPPDEAQLRRRRLADLVRGKIEPITSIGDHTLFLGERSLCVSHSLYKGSKSFSNILPNSIICMHTLQRYPGSEGPAHFEQYDLGTGIWTAASDGGHFRKTTTKPPHTYPPYLYFLFDDV
uniref:DUF295 domain-containing protein n=1 Tax=Leersia perrieri TaxID=77586 RepID=A0A0D9XSX0_9ORYZ